jgi:hypothetical protein
MMQELCSKMYTNYIIHEYGRLNAENKVINV